jgi:uncharacterized protein (TIGR01777 family)
VKIAISGSSGLIGTALTAHLRSLDHLVVRLVRRAAVAPDEVRWDPAAGTVDLDGLAGVDGVVHLAGVGVGDHRWSESYKQQILESRVQGTTTIARAIASLDPKPSVLVSASASGWYGDTGEAKVDESVPNASGRFLADVVRRWEEAAEPARAAGIRVVHPRSGLVMTKKGGALKRMLPIVRLGGGGPLGSGRQYWPVISLHDEVRAMTYLLTSDLSGPVNLSIPDPPTNKEFTAALGDALHRPTFLPAPAFAIKAVVGGFGDEVLVSTRMVPAALLASGFSFDDPTSEDVVRRALSD